MSGHICLLVSHSNCLGIGYGLFDSVFPVFVK